MTMAYEIRTPILATVADKLMGVMNGVETDEIETGKANAMIRAGAGIRSAMFTIELPCRATRASSNSLGPSRKPPLASSTTSPRLRSDIR